MKHLSPPIAKLPRPGALRPLDAREARQILRRHGETYAHEDVERGLAAARQMLRLLTKAQPGR